jgi:hypothetical protein
VFAWLIVSCMMSADEQWDLSTCLQQLWHQQLQGSITGVCVHYRFLLYAAVP